MDSAQSAGGAAETAEGPTAGSGPAAPTRLALLASDSPPAREALAQLSARYPVVPVEQADAIVALGGDGFLLETVHANLHRRLPIFGMNCGTVGFLLNPFGADALPARLAAAKRVCLHPLRMRCWPSPESTDSPYEALAFNEVSLLRESRQAAKIRILVDGIARLDELVCDGILVATPAGSTAYNMSAHGPILPLTAGLLAVTPISAFRPRRWRGALLPHTAQVRLEILEVGKRPVSATADFTEVRDVHAVEIFEDRSVSQDLLFDPGHDLEERIVKEQFLP